MWVKICGTTNLEDALLAVDAGADALGFIFAPSARRTSPKDAKRIITALPSDNAVEKIGVFVNQGPNIILQTIEAAGLSGVQLHGDEDPEFIRDLRERTAVTVDRVVSMHAVAHNAAELLEYVEAGARHLLLDSGTTERRGGTGKTFDWGEAAPLARMLARKAQVVIAGGLKPENVMHAIELFRPFGVDVVSGVESAAGKKDPDKVRAFVAMARSAAAQLEVTK